MIFCNHCNEQVICNGKLNMDVAMWGHLKEKHPKIFKQESSKELEDIWKDNFRSDIPESDYNAVMDSLRH